MCDDSDGFCAVASVFIFASQGNNKKVGEETDAGMKRDFSKRDFATSGANVSKGMFLSNSTGKTDEQ